MEQRPSQVHQSEEETFTGAESIRESFIEKLNRRQEERSTHIGFIKVKLERGSEILKAVDRLKKLDPERVISRDDEGNMEISLTHRQTHRLGDALLLLERSYEYHAAHLRDLQTPLPSAAELLRQ